MFYMNLALSLWLIYYMAFEQELTNQMGLLQAQITEAHKRLRFTSVFICPSIAFFRHLVARTFSYLFSICWKKSAVCTMWWAFQSIITSMIHVLDSCWSNPDKIDNVEHLRQMENSLSESLNLIRLHKVSSSCTFTFIYYFSSTLLSSTIFLFTLIFKY